VKAARQNQSRMALAPSAAARRSCMPTYRGALIAIGLGLLLLVACGSNDLPRNTQTVDGITIYIGVIPAELVQGHSTSPGDPKALHGGTPPNRNSHHLVVALFDAKTGARITDAQIRAGVGHRFEKPVPDTVLAPMEINGAMSYGNFFLMQGTGDWKIHLDIRRSDLAHPVEADFSYGHIADR